MTPEEAAVEKKSQIHALAALVGQTNSQLKALDENIVSSSTNLQKSRDNWSAETYLQKGYTGNCRRSDGCSDRCAATSSFYVY